MTMKFAYVLVASALLIAVGAVAYGAWQLTRDEEEPVHSGRNEPVDNEWNPLLVDERTRLSICFDGVGGARASVAERAFVERVVDDAIEDATLPVPASYEGWKLVRGCPAPNVNVNVTRDKDQPGDWGRNVDAASEHRVFVYFLPNDEYASAFGSEPYYKSVEEVLCHGDVCEEVTRGLYLPSRADAEAAQEAMSRLLHLVPPPTPPATSHEGDATEPAQEQGR